MPASEKPALDQSAKDKASFRADAIARRDALTSDERAAGAEIVARRPFPLAVTADTIVSAYAPMRSEFDPYPLMRRLADAGASLALPVVQARGQPLAIRAYAFGDDLNSGIWGIREPKPEAPEVFPDIMLVPLTAFDRKGHRIGYGAGYYDRTIVRVRANKPMIAIGLAFATQEIERVPATVFDAPLDLVLTEREVIDFRGS